MVIYSFYEYCIDNNKSYLLNLWDYELNDKSPSDISYQTNKKYWFKCPRGIHSSELYTISNLIKRKYKMCRQCNSFGQWLIDTHGKDAIELYWSKKNKINPFDISRGSSKKVWIICQCCKNDKFIMCNNYIKNGLMCNKCSDNISYPNKFVYEFLKQLNLDFELEKRFDWGYIENNKNDKLNGRKIYDIYVPSLNLIIENHGEQHYINSFKHSKRTLKDEQENDKLKKELALNNGIKYYIELDCRKSKLEWMKQIILTNTVLNELLILSENTINWKECDKFANSNLMIHVCELWENKKEYEFVKDIAKRANLSTTTVIKYLKNGNKLGLCKYNPVLEKERNTESKSIKVGVFKDGTLYITMKSIKDLERKSIEIFGEKIGYHKLSYLLDSDKSINNLYIKKLMK